MTLSPGNKLGPYEIIAQAGAGGMGEVFKAKDTRLDRIVAIKVLPSHISANSELRQRFDREAKAISSLSHANICTLYDVGHQDGIDYLVMEYLEGETLSERIKRTPLSSDEIFRYAVQIGDALSVAHARGLIHRDLKPGNVIITKDNAKLLDFGLAKLQSGGGTVEAITQTTPLTGTGTIVGTMHYMSPEQLEAGEADARSDIFAYGAMLYEMVTGQRAFDGKSQASLIAAILEREPRPVTELKPTSPPALDRVISKCLAKDPNKRWQSARDMVDELRWISGGGGSQVTSGPVIVHKRRTSEWVGRIIAAVAILFAIGTYFYSRLKTPIPQTRTVINAPKESVFHFGGDYAGPPVISPDGKQIAFVAVSPAGQQVWIRELSDLNAHVLSGTENASFPFWSPDGKSVGFATPEALKRIDIATGQVLTIASPVATLRGASWGPNNSIVFAPTFMSDLYSISATGGEPTKITRKDSAVHTSYRWPIVLPDGKHVLFFAGNHNSPDSTINQIYWASLDGSEEHPVVSALAHGDYADGYLLYVRDSVLFAQEFDQATGTLSGAPIPTRERVQIDATTWKANFSVSQAGMLTYQLVGGRQGCQLHIVDRTGRSVRSLGDGANIHNIQMDRQGQGVVFCMQEIPTGDIYYYDLNRDMRRRLTFAADDEDCPIISPSGDRIIFSALDRLGQDKRSAIMQVAASGAGDRKIVAEDLRDVYPMDWSPDGKYLLCGIGNYSKNGSPGAFIFPLGNPEQQVRFIPERDQITSARFSPDGKWVAFASSVGGSPQVYVTSSPTVIRGESQKDLSVDEASASRWQISASGGRYPRWRADSKELYYIRGDGTAVSVEVNATSTEFHVGHEVEMFRLVLSTSFECWDPFPDGQQFLVSVLAGEGSTPIVVVQNWAAELKR